MNLNHVERIVDAAFGPLGFRSHAIFSAKDMTHRVMIVRGEQRFSKDFDGVVAIDKFLEQMRDWYGEVRLEAPPWTTTPPISHSTCRTAA